MNPGHAGYETESFDPTDILAGNYPLADLPIVLASGQNGKRGWVIGKITASGKYVLSLAAAEDGSQTPVGILAFDQDASAADRNASMYLSGEFDQDALIYGAGHDAASVKAAFANKPIFLKKCIA